MKKLLISFSGGRTSALMSKYLMESDKYKEFEKLCIFANTGKERPETIDFVKKCNDEFNLNLVMVEPVFSMQKGVGVKHKIVDFDSIYFGGLYFEQMAEKYGLPKANFSLCTDRLKIQPIHSFCRSIGWNKGDYLEAIGIRIDETQRINWENAKKNNKIYPLVSDFRVNSDYVRQFWKHQKFDLNLKDYEGNCDMCFKKSNRMIMTLMLEKPEMADWWINYENEFGSDEMTLLRDGMTFADLLEKSKRPFHKAIDKFEAKEQQIKLLDYDVTMDISGNCHCKI